MVAFVVYESIWGNTATVARAIGQGLGSKSRVLSTAEAIPDEIEGSPLLVLGAPVHSYQGPEFVAIQAGREIEVPPSRTTPSAGLVLMLDWIKGLPASQLPIAVFEIRIPDLEGQGGARDVIDALDAHGHSLVTPAESFQMERFPLTPGLGGWIRPEELKRARAWGDILAHLIGSS